MLSQYPKIAEFLLELAFLENDFLYLSAEQEKESKPITL